MWIAIYTELTKSGYVEISMGISKCIIMDRNYSADTEILWGGRVVLSKDGSNGVANPLLIITLIILFLIEGMMLPYFSAESKIKYIYATILPCYILYVSLPGQEIIRYFKMFAKLLTIASTIVVVCGIFDIFIGTSIGKTIAEFSAADSLIESIRQGRMVSYFGHPLLTSEVMILCFSFNTLVNYCIEKKTVIETVYYSMVSVIGIGLCGSKTGLILDISCKKSVLRVLRVALVISLNVILYKLLVGKYVMNSWGEWIMYAVIASIIALVTAGLIYFITERNQFLTCINMIIKRKVKR